MSSSKTKKSKIEDDDINVDFDYEETYINEVDNNEEIDYDKEDEMDKYCNKVEFIYKLINNIKNYTDYYVLPIAKNISVNDMEHFLDHLYHFS